MGNQIETAKNRPALPGILWILPICFGIIGGTVAALIANLKYQASWWELFVVGAIVSFLAGIGYILIIFSLF